MKEPKNHKSNNTVALSKCAERIPQMFEPPQFELNFTPPPPRSVAEVVFAHCTLSLITAIICLLAL